MTVHTSSSPPVKDYGGELGLFPVKEPEPASSWISHLLVFVSTCLFCTVVVASLSMMRHPENKVQMDGDFSQPLQPFEQPENLVDPKCDHGYTLYDPTKKCFKVVNKEETLHKASLTCLEDQAFLSSASDAKENEFIVKLFEKINNEEETLVADTEENNTKKSEIWIGLVEINGRWLWLDRSEQKYSNWDKGMPIHNKDDRCVVVQLSEGEKWKNVKCHKKNAFVCQKKPIA